MSRDKQPDPDEITGQVQDYLDVLLMSATEQPTAQVDLDATIEKPVAVVAPISINNNERRGAKLAMVGGTHARSKPAEAIPFAEPKPLTLNMPLPSTVHQHQIEQRSTLNAQPVVDRSTAQTPLNEKKLKLNPEKSKIKSELLAQPQITPAEAIDPAVVQQAVHETSTWMSNGRPEWAQERFECLLFKVGGLSLAVPLVELGTIYPMTEELTPLFGQADWFMGLLTVKQHNIRTVNTAKIVMPERYIETMNDDFTYVLSINGVDWGLAVDDVANAVTLDPDAVRWRSERSKRPWLAGTVVEHMCALLDISQLAAMFLSEDKHQ